MVQLWELFHQKRWWMEIQSNYASTFLALPDPLLLTTKPSHHWYPRRAVLVVCKSHANLPMHNWASGACLVILFQVSLSLHMIGKLTEFLGCIEAAVVGHSLWRRPPCPSRIFTQRPCPEMWWFQNRNTPRHTIIGRSDVLIDSPLCSNSSSCNREDWKGYSP